MITNKSYTLAIDLNFDKTELQKNTWLVILHATRIPPHIGILINGNYNSLTIKGHELNINYAVLLKSIQQKKIATVFINLVKHPVFSSDFQNEMCHHYIKQFIQVTETNSCLSPMKLYLQEFYALQLNNNELLFEMIERLKQNNYITKSFSKNIEIDKTNTEFEMPIYTNSELIDVIKTERLNYYKK